MVETYIVLIWRSNVIMKYFLDLQRRPISLEERVFLEENKLVSNIMADLGTVFSNVWINA